MSDARAKVSDATIEVVVGRVGEIPSGTGRAVDAAGREIAVFNLDGEHAAVAGRCLHRGGPLAEGFVRDGTVTCPWHWWRYDLRTGASLGPPGAQLERFPVEIRGCDLVIQVPAPGPVESIRDRLLRRIREERARR
jgi:nitrite reductase (NADH) small subunit